MESIIKKVSGCGSGTSSSENISEQAQKTEEQILTENGFYWRERSGVKVLICRPLENEGFVNGFSTRLGGVSKFSSISKAAEDEAIGNDLNLAGFDEDQAENIYENRRRFLRAFDNEYTLAVVWQVHGDKIKLIRHADDIAADEERADAIVSNLPGILAGVKTADCVPTLLGDPATKTFAAVHAGWRGTVQSIVAKAVAKMSKIYRVDPSNVIAAIGPAASCKSYEIGKDVIDAFHANFSDSAKYFTPTSADHALIDLHRANRDQLINIGVPNENIFITPLCTMERTDLFFSYRREKKTLGKTGRLLSVIGLDRPAQNAA